jgi:formiminoglutamase
MSSASSSAAGWSTRLQLAEPPADLPGRPDDPRLGAFVEAWTGDSQALAPGRPVLLGFPQDEGVRRNGGRPGAAGAPREVRRWLARLVPYDPAHDIDLAPLRPLDLGDLCVSADLEGDQRALGEVVGAVLAAGAVPIVLGGGHETAYGHFLGHVAAGRPVALVNLDAHLDVRPLLGGQGHSGSPFRQALEHPTHPLPGERYVVLGAQPSSVSRDHLAYLRQRGGRVYWKEEVAGRLGEVFDRERERLGAAGCRLHVSVDADVARAADVPGVSAPNPLGLAGDEVADCARRAGAAPEVASLDLVEVSPLLDPDGRSARWAALVVWHFLAGLAARPGPEWRGGHKSQGVSAP